MIIRQQQMEALSDHMRQQFEDRMVAHVRANFPDLELTSDEQSLRSTIRQGIDRAARYDVTSEDDIARYLEYMMALFPDFDTNPATSWAGQILREREANGTQKMRWIDNVYIFSRKGQI